MKHLIAVLLSAAIVAPVAMPTAAVAQRHRAPAHHQTDHRWQGDSNSKWDPSSHYQSGNYRERRLGRNDRVYRGGDGRYYCKRNDGTTGLVIGALGGGLLGNVLGGGTLGTLLGAGGGALLGQSVDKGNVKCR